MSRLQLSPCSWRKRLLCRTVPVVDHLTVGYFTPNILLDVCRSTGTLAGYGITVTETRVRSSIEQFRSLVAGDLDVAFTNPDNVLCYRFDPHNGLSDLFDVRIIGAVDRGMGLGLYVRDGTTPADLVGARVAVDVAGSGFALVLYDLLEAVGLSRDQYDVVPLGATPRRLSALSDGDCDATMLNGGNELIAERAGCVRLLSASERLPSYIGGVVAVAGERHVDAATKLTRALLTTADAILEGELSAVAERSASRLLGMDDRLAAAYVARMRDPAEGLIRGGTVDRDGLAALVRLRIKHLPRPGPDGTDLLEAALRPDAGFVVER